MIKRNKDKLRRFIIFTILVLSGLIIKIFIVGLEAPSTDKSNMHNFLLYANIPAAPQPVPYEVYLASQSKLEATTRNNQLLSSELENMKTFREKDKIRKDIMIKVMNKNLGGKLSDKGEIIYNASTANKYHPYLQCAIVIHETGNGTSIAVRNLNNVGGIFAGDSLRMYNNIDDGIWDMATRIKRYYIEEGLTTIDKFGAKYCPIGVSNDPTGLNKHWVPAVSRNYIKLLNESSGVI
jgi:hypothetical protein